MKIKLNKSKVTSFAIAFLLQFNLLASEKMPEATFASEDELFFDAENNQPREQKAKITEEQQEKLIQALSLENSAKAKSVEQLTKEISDLEKASNGGTAASVKRYIKSLQSQIKILESKKEKEQLTTKVNALNSKNESLEKEIGQLTAKLTEKEQELKDIKNESANKPIFIPQEDVDSNKTMIQDVNSAMQNLTLAEQQTSDLIDQLTLVKAEYDRIYAENQSTITSLNKELAKQAMQNNTLSQDNVALEAINQQLKDSIEQLNQNFDNQFRSLTDLSRAKDLIVGYTKEALEWQQQINGLCHGINNNSAITVN